MLILILASIHTTPAHMLAARTRWLGRFEMHDPACRQEFHGGDLNALPSEALPCARCFYGKVGLTARAVDHYNSIVERVAWLQRAIASWPDRSGGVTAEDLANVVAVMLNRAPTSPLAS